MPLSVSILLLWKPYIYFKKQYGATTIFSCFLSRGLGSFSIDVCMIWVVILGEVPLDPSGTPRWSRLFFLLALDDLGMSFGSSWGTSGPPVLS
jgi:hypothetical protein